MRTASVAGLVWVLAASGCKNKPIDRYVQVVAGGDLTCARTVKGLVYCWGDNAFTSTGMTAAELPPGKRRVPVMVGLVQDAVDLDVGSSYGCAVDNSGRVACFRDSTVDVPGHLWALVARPIQTGEVKDVVQVSLNVASMPRVCVRSTGGLVSCARGERDGDIPPLEKVPIDDATTISSGDMQACAVRAAGGVWCWKASTESPTQELVNGTKSISLASVGECWLEKDDHVACQSRFGPPPSVAMKRVAAGVYHACGIDLDGHVHCWGENDFGQLGERDGTRVRDVDQAVDVTCGTFHTCALVADGKILCWGRNQRGQLGNGTSDDARQPTPVISVAP